MGGVLLLLQLGRGNPAVDQHFLPDGGDRLLQQDLEARQRRGDQRDGIGFRISLEGGGIHVSLPLLRRSIREESSIAKAVFWRRAAGASRRPLTPLHP